MTVELCLRRYKCSAEIKENVLHFKKFRRSLRVCKYTVPVYHSKNEIQLMLLTLDGGWSRPIPYHIFRNWSIGYTEIYDEFFKQVHSKMEVLNRCRDSNLLEDT